MTVRAVRPWRYRIVETEEGGSFDLHIESGFASWSEPHPLSADDLDALAADPNRADILFVALHPLGQDGDEVPAGLIGSIAHAPRAEVEALMDRMDRARSGMHSNLLRILRGHPERTWFGGWFPDAAGSAR